MSEFYNSQLMNIKTEYYFEGTLYNGSNLILDSEHVNSIDTYLQNRYFPFADRIIAEEGHLKVDLSLTDVPKQVHYEANPIGISDQLSTDIANYFDKLDGINR